MLLSNHGNRKSVFYRMMWFVYIELYLIAYNLRRFQMEQNPNKIQDHGDTKKLSFLVVFLSIFVIVLFGLAPLV